MRIIVFDIDCLRPDHLGCYGYNRPTSPTIDSIAENGTIFTHYYCADGPCLPSRTGLISGRFGINNGVVSNAGKGANFRIKIKSYIGPAEENEIFMRLLRKKAGIDTIGISNFADRHNFMWFMCGWSEYYTPNLKGGGETADEINEVAIRWIRKNSGRDNFLLYLNYWDTHRCYKMDTKFSERFKDYPVTQEWPDEDTIKKHLKYKGPFTAMEQFKDNISPVPLMPGCIKTRKDFEHLLTGYDTSIYYVDLHIEQILTELEKNKMLDDTIFIITSDHGDAFGESGIYSDHVCADECINHIPLIINWPEISKVRKVDGFFYNIDLPATICDILGIEKPELWDGISSKENLLGKKEKGRDYLVWGHALYTVQRAVRTEEYLMIRTYDVFSFSWEQFPPVQLYEIEKDKYQTENIAEKRKDIVAKCDNLLNEWLHNQKRKKSFTVDPFDIVLLERKNSK